MKSIYFWSPFIGKVATIKAVLNSIYSINKYSKNRIKPFLIDACGEWKFYEEYIKNQDIEIKKLDSQMKIDITTTGLIKSRVIFFKIFLNSFFLLKNLLQKDRPTYLMVHLITSLPLILFIFFKFETKLILRISGKVKMNFFRKTIWKLASKKIHIVFCPTTETKNEINKMNLFNKDKIIFLPDPIINIKLMNKLKRKPIENSLKNIKYFASVGRFTKQKNHILLMKSFKNIVKRYNNLRLIIIGDGELKKSYYSFISKYQLQKKIIILDHKKNVLNYICNSLALISTSLWEDPGFVMVEAAAINTFVISSDCPSGPVEFISNDGGLLFENGNEKSLEEVIYKFINLRKDQIINYKKNLKKKSSRYTLFKHYSLLSTSLNL